MKIIVDFDNTIVDSSRAIFDIYKKETGDNIRKWNNDFLWNFEGLLPSSYTNRAIQLFGERIFYDNIKFKNGCYENLKKLHDDGNDIVVCSVHDKDTIYLKDEWIVSNLPFIKDRIFINNTGEHCFDKSSVKGDVLVDDKVSCHKGLGRKLNILFGGYRYQKEQYLNKEDKLLLNRLTKSNNWNDVYDRIINLY